MDLRDSGIDSDMLTEQTDQQAELEKLERELEHCLRSVESYDPLAAVCYSHVAPSLAMMLAQPGEASALTIFSFLVAYVYKITSLFDGRIQDLETEQRLRGAIRRMREKIFSEEYLNTIFDQQED